MEILLLILLIIAVAALAFLLVSLSKRVQEPAIDPQFIIALQQKLDLLQNDMKGSMFDSLKNQQQSHASMTNTVRDVSERLVKIEETNKQILSFSGHLENLQRILTNPKQRGILGEYYLETLLKNIFSPEQYQMQYKFKDGLIVDAVVFVRGQIIPIDSKFSLENYNRLIEEISLEERTRLEKVFLNDLKQRILETSKYIRPQEGTMEFAFMFIPHEAIYYDLLVNKSGIASDENENLLQRAAAKYHVIIVSPTSFSAYLQTVLQGLNALKIEEQAKEIRLRVMDLSRHLSVYQQYFSNVGKHLGTAVNQYNLATKEFAKVDKDVTRISGQSIGYEALAIDRPASDE